ncbi:MAG TPA: hypothetical protein VJ648_02280, partial [Vicinamibacteria bacterium]|nr:hypothetical protein [Vicinamibacteria bacterium]
MGALAATLFATPAATPAQAPAATEDKGALALARLSLVERKVELEKKGAKWQAAVEGGPLSIGEALRTGPDAVARLELPWMALTLSPGSSLRFPDEFLLSATLDSGRALVEAPSLDALKIVTGEAEVRGQGRAVVRRQGRSTLVTCLAGRFFVEAAGSIVTLTPGRGTVVAAGRAPGAPQDVPAAPTEGLWPAQDPVFVAPAEPLELRWKGTSPSYQLELLPVGSDVVLLQRDVTTSPVKIEVPWEGAFRWRVSARDARGLEGVPSADGLIAVDA